MSPALLAMSAFKVSCGTRRAPRNSMASMGSPPAGFGGFHRLRRFHSRLHGPLLLGRLLRWLLRWLLLLRRALRTGRNILKRIFLRLRRSGRWLLRLLLRSRRWLRGLRLRAKADESSMRRDRPMLPSGECARNASCKHTFPLCVATETLMHANQFHSIRPISKMASHYSSGSSW